MNAAKLLMPILVALVAAACMNPGEAIEFGQCKLYYKEPVTSEQAQRVGKVLMEAGYFVESVKRDVQVLKDGETYVLRFVFKPEEVTPDAETVLGGMRIALSEALGGSEPRIEFCDSGLNVIRTL